jgi:hypothetical protein
MRWVVVTGLLVACRSETEVAAPRVPVWGDANPPPVQSAVVEDRILQTTIPSVDALFVVDNSCSMAEEQSQLGANFPSMLDWFLDSGLDHHVGVVSTDMFDPLHTGKLREVGGVRWIDAATEGPESLFAQMVEMGTTGHWDEKGRAAAYTAIEVQREAANLGFVREEAGMHITVVSDENDASGDSPVSRDEFVDFLETFRWSRRLVSFSSIVGPLSGCPYIGDPGTEYLQVTAEVGGVTWPICSADWTEVLDELGFLAVGLSREFFLSRLPVESTIEVLVESGGNTLPFAAGSDWTWSRERNSVTFLSYLPEPLATVVIRYRVLASEDAAPTEPPAPEE